MLAVENADAVPWLIAAAIAFAIWLMPFTIVSRKTMPRLPEPGPETMELGPEPPGIANLLVNRCKLTTSALSATLVDLAARRHVNLDHIGDGDNLVRLRAQTQDSTNAYEGRLLELVRSRARGNTVPATELSLGYGKDADQWWKKFQKAVIEHAREADLVRRRFTTAQIIFLAGTLAIVFAVAGIGFEVYGAARRADGEDQDAGGGMMMAGFLWLVVLMIGAAVLRGWRETPAGSAAAAHWLGVRNFLSHDDAFRETPPAGVAIWDRLLAYGVAVGVAHGCDAALPIGPTRDDEGWSPYRGLWRQVRIRYPKRFRYGDSPVRAALFSGLVLVAATIFGFMVGGAIVPALADVVDEVADGDAAAERWATLGAGVFVALPVTIALLFVVRAGVILWRAVTDFGKSETFDGYVVRVPWHYVNEGDDRVFKPTGYTAVDDGQDEEVRALRYYTADIREGATVRVTVTPRMRHVIRMEVLPASS